MPSIQAKLLNIGLRYFVKRRLRKENSLLELRKDMETYLGGDHQWRHTEIRPLVRNEDNGNNSLPLHGEWVTHETADTSRVLVFLHGGAYCLGSPRTHRDVTWRLSRDASCRVLALDYRKAPEHPFPAGLNDAVACYEWLLSKGYAADNIAFAGDSAGGGLSLATALTIRDNNLPTPAAVACFSPWTDLAMTGESVTENYHSDVMLPVDRNGRVIEPYLGEHPVDHPLISPLYADLHDLPPILLHVSQSEAIRDDSVRFAEKLRHFGGEVILERWDDMPHAWHDMARFLPEGRTAIKRAGRFLDAQFRRMPNSHVVALAAE